MNSIRRRVFDNIFMGLSAAATFFVLFYIVFILSKITLEALPSLSLEFILTTEAEREGFGGAILNAIVGTILLSTLSTAIAGPVGLCMAIYVVEYCQNDRLRKFISYIVDLLACTPSILIGAVGFIVLVYYLKPLTGGFSLLSGICALTLLILPFSFKYAEEAIRICPFELKAASYSLGASKWETLKRVVIPTTLPGILAGILLSFARAAESAAVALLTAGYSQFLPDFGIKPSNKIIFGFEIDPLHEVVGSLPVAVYNGFRYPHLVDRSESFACAFVMICFIILVNVISRVYLKRRMYRTPTD